MPELKLRYFDFHGGRGEPARLAFAMGGVAFDDERIPVADWPSRKASTPLGAIPVLEVDGEAITQSSAILRYAGRLTGMYPDDAIEALRCDEIIDAIEDMTMQLVATFGIEDDDEMRARRSDLVETVLTPHLRWLDAKLAASGEFLLGAAPSVADLKAFVVVRTLRSGQLDHVPTDLVASVAPRVEDWAARFEKLPVVTAYYDGF